MLTADVVVGHGERFLGSGLERLYSQRSEDDALVRTIRRRAQGSDQFGAEIGRVDVERLEHVDGEAATLVEETEQEVLGAHSVVWHLTSGVLSECEGLSGAGSEAAERAEPGMAFGRRLVGGSQRGDVADGAFERVLAHG